jgi:hypothetical protein
VAKPVTKPVRTFSDLDELLERTGFTEAGPHLRQLARRCWHVLPDSNAHLSLIGDSRLGGRPVLAEGSSWPRSNDGKLLDFFGQLRLSEIARLEPASGLPPSGLLSLFAGNARHYPIKSHAVLTQVGTTVERLPRPPKGALIGEQYFDPVIIRFEPGLSFPPDDAEILSLEGDWPEGEFDALRDSLYTCRQGAIGRLLGHGPWTQGGDLRQAVYFEEIGRLGKHKLLAWRSWESWEEAKKVRRGRYHPWSSRDDENVRWILENQSAISAGIEQWRFLLRGDAKITSHFGDLLRRIWADGVVPLRQSSVPADVQ